MTSVDSSDGAIDAMSMRGAYVAEQLEDLSFQIDDLLRQAEEADEVPFGAASATQEALSALDTAIRRWR